MMKIEIKLGSLILIIILIGVGVYFLFSKRINPFHPTNYADTTYVYDTTKYVIYDTIPYPVPVPVKVIDTLTYSFYDTITTYDTIPIAETPDEVIADYYRLRFYSDTISDKNLDFYIREQIGANRILKRSTSYVIKKPQTIITQRPNYIYLGGSMSLHSTIPSVMYTNDKLYLGLGYDVIQKTPVVSGGMRLLSW